MTILVTGFFASFLAVFMSLAFIIRSLQAGADLKADLKAWRAWQQQRIEKERDASWRRNKQMIMD